MINDGNKTKWNPIRSVITPVICLITSMITDRTGPHEVLLPVNHNYNNRTNSEFFASSEKKPLKCARARIVQLLRHDAYSPITRSY